MRRILGELGPRVLMLGGAAWTAKGLFATVVPSPSLEPLYAAGFLGGGILFFAALALAVPGSLSGDDGIWIGVLLLALILTVLLVAIGGPLRSAGAEWYGVELPIVLAGLVWILLGIVRGLSPLPTRGA